MGRTIRVDYLARVEGETSVRVKLRGEEVVEVGLDIFEPPRFFEALLRGRAGSEAPDITSRICGICPVAYQLTACSAIERALGVEPGSDIRALRRLLYTAEWASSHALHVYLLHLPDFFGFPDAISMASRHGELVRRGLRIKKAATALMAAIGGRDIHPINVCVGGFYRAPAREKLAALVGELRWAREATLETLEMAGTLPFPDVERDWELVALRHPDAYPIEAGRIASTRGLDIDAADWETSFVEEQVPRSTALHARLVARGNYLCGPLARFALNHERLDDETRTAAARAGLAPTCRNPFRAILARLAEMAYAFGEAAEHIERYRPPTPPRVAIAWRASEGAAATEAPRGTLWHRYRMDDEGNLTDARIVPPTSQNQATIEDDLRALGPALSRLSNRDATSLVERLVRSYDPCISCASHFLTLRVEREPEP